MFLKYLIMIESPDNISFYNDPYINNIELIKNINMTLKLQTQTIRFMNL
jgi:hypothetical protein